MNCRRLVKWKRGERREKGAERRELIERREGRQAVCTAAWRVVEAVAELSLHTGGSMQRSLLGSVAIDVAC